MDNSKNMTNHFLEVIWSRMNLSDLTLRRLSALFYLVFEPILIEPPVKKMNGRWCTWVRADIIQFLDSWSPHVSGKVLDIGGGTWTYPRELFSGKCDYRVVDSRVHPNVDIIGDVNHLSELFEPNSFDCLLCIDVLEHVVNPAAVVNEMHAILKPGAKLLLTAPFNFHIHSTTFPDYWRITEQGLKELLSSFCDVRIKSTGPKRFPRSYLVEASK